MSIAKFRKFYKPNNNILTVDGRIESYEFEVDTKQMCTYTFDNDNHCIFISIMGKLTEKKNVEDIFPEDLNDFIFDLIRITKIEINKKIHVVLNEHHILYSCSILQNLTSKHIGVIICELPFTNVQSMTKNILQPANLHIAYIVDSKGDLFGLEKNSKEVPFLNSIENKRIDESIKSNIYDLIQSEILKTIFRKLFEHLDMITSEDIMFGIFSENESFEQKNQITISKVKILDKNDVNSSSIFLINSEIKSQKKLDYTHNASLKTDFIPGYETYKVCTFCKKINTPMTITPVAERNIVPYEDIIAPIFDNVNNIPLFGRRSRNDKISKKDVDADNIWTNMREWNSHVLSNKHTQNMYVVYDACSLCKDEIRCYFLQTLRIRIEL